jgi:adenosylcobinamide-phosphate synthase (EC 6.3.1.10)
MDIKLLYTLLPLLIGWTADKLFGDPRWLPHPVVAMGKIIAWGEKRLNKGNKRMMKGALFSIILILSSFLVIFFIVKGLDYLSPYLSILFSSVVVFFCLAGKTLIDEVRNVFVAVDSSVEEGRKQVARIVGRDTSALSPQQIRTAALETLSENLSDGVIAPLFWFILLGVPGMFAYKMVNTLDSMIGYKSDRYKQFGCWAARIDDVANYIPARLTSLLMIVVSGKISLLSFVRKFGSQHASPNSGYPEAALAGILNCRFGGSNVYFGQRVEKPYIGYNDKELTYTDLKIAVRVNIRTEILMVFAVCVDLFLLLYF